MRTKEKAKRKWGWNRVSRSREKPVKKDRFRWNLSIFHWCVDTNQCADTNQRTDTNQWAYAKLRPYTHVCTLLKKLKIFSLAETKNGQKIIFKEHLQKKFSQKFSKKIFQKRFLKKSFKKKIKKKFQEKNLKKNFQKKFFSGPLRTTAP